VRSVVSVVISFDLPSDALDRKVATTLFLEIETYLEVLVAGLLVLLGHGGRLATSEEASGTE
jgi:hypothetical protein